MRQREIMYKTDTRKNKLSRATFLLPFWETECLISWCLLCSAIWHRLIESFCFPGHPVNKHWWERKGEWSYNSLMRLLWHGLLACGTASCRVPGCMLSTCRQTTEASIRNGGWSLGTGHPSTPLATWSHQATLLLYDETAEGANGIGQIRNWSPVSTPV